MQKTRWILTLLLPGFQDNTLNEHCEKNIDFVTRLAVILYLVIIAFNEIPADQYSVYRFRNRTVLDGDKPMQ